MITNEFFITSGSITGTIHRNRYRNNQDAVCIAENDDALIGVVADGCSEGRHNEVGAKLFSRFICNQGLKLAHKLNKGNIDKFFIRLRHKSLKFMRHILNTIGDNSNQTLQNMFLFTIIGTVITHNIAIIFTMGDGAYVLNDRLYVIDSDNKPDYLAYGLIEELVPTYFTIRSVLETKRLENIMLCTDGINYLLNASTTTLKDGSSAGNHTRFLNEDRYIRNPSLLQKRLVVLGAINSILKDDTSIILIRRKKSLINKREDGGRTNEGLC
jgi:hypothetical protein